MIRVPLALVFVALSAAPALAYDRDCDFAGWGGSTTVRQRDGQIIGNVENTAMRTTFRNARGSIVGFASVSDTGRTTYRDDDGTILGTRDVTGAGSIIYRDDNGSILDAPPPRIERFCRDR